VVVKTLVTGGAGFIGSTLVDRLLAEGHAVDVIDDLSSGNLGNLADARASDGEFSFHQLDICSDSVVELIERRQPEVVYHLAAQADVRVSVRTPALDARINIMGSINVLEGARRAGSRKIAFASSGGTIYGEPDADDLPLTEAQPQKPTSPYGVSKRVVSDYLSVYRQIHGINWTSLALANVFGPRQDPHGEAGVVSIFASRLLAGDSCTIFGSGDQTRDFVFVDDVADAFFRAATRGDDLLINIGTGTETSVNQLYKSMADAADIGDPPSYEEARDGEIDRSCLDAARAKIQLGWEPWTDVATGAQAVIDWERSRQG
jgi:UDP-glucose 4-epimerase